MSWTTPKTNWKVTLVDGEYTGDYFDSTDYNRIKGNIEYLAQLPDPAVTIINMGNNKVVGDLIFPEEFNTFQYNLDLIGFAVGTRYNNYPIFFSNGNTPTFEDLNQIESFILVLHDILSGSAVYAIDTNNLYAVSDGEKAKAEGS